MRKLKKKNTVVDVGVERRSLIFAWSRPWSDFLDTYLSTISDDRGNREIPDLFQTYGNQASIWSS